MSSSESSGRRSKRRRKRRGRQDPPPVSSPSASTAVADEPPPVDESGRDDGPAAEWTADDLQESEIVDEVRTVKDPEEGQKPEDADRLAELTCELIERDELITALTEQLEDAAERLDRLRREGVDRGPSGSTSNPGFTLPPGGTELKDQINQLVGAWEDLDAGTWMETFDRKLDELTSMVSRGNSAGPNTTRASHPLTDSWMGTMGDSSASTDEAPASRLAGWEEMKAQLMNERDPEDQGQASSDDEAIPAALGDSSAWDASAVEGTSGTAAKPAWDLEAPKPVDFDEADREDLIVAVEERDEFISHLIRRLRSAPTGAPERIDWERLNNAPEEMREKLQELEARLSEVLRMEECDLSLERARLARERARLEQMGRKVRRLRSGQELDVSVDAEEDEDDPEVSQNDHHWLRMFGFGRKSGQAKEGPEDSDDLD